MTWLTKHYLNVVLGERMAPVAQPVGATRRPFVETSTASAAESWQKEFHRPIRNKRQKPTVSTVGVQNRISPKSEQPVSPTHPLRHSKRREMEGASRSVETASG
jgi:hypothetical protein